MVTSRICSSRKKQGTQQVSGVHSTQIAPAEKSTLWFAAQIAYTKDPKLAPWSMLSRLFLPWASGQRGLTTFIWAFPTPIKAAAHRSLLLPHTIFQMWWLAYAPTPLGVFLSFSVPSSPIFCHFYKGWRLARTVLSREQAGAATNAPEQVISYI